MYGFVGLGNPGDRYRLTRHNAGFQCVDYLYNLEGIRVVSSFNHTHATMQHITYQGREIILAKPLTYMNISGKAVKYVMAKYRIAKEHLAIIHDDLDIPFGKVKVQRGKGPQSHNGLRSIEAELETQDFWRVRIGIDNRSKDEHIAGESYTLQNFTTQERERLPHVLQDALVKIMNVFHIAHI